MRETVAKLTSVAAESPADIDRLRAILIACGQWEQAAADAKRDEETLTALRDLTDCAADAFCLAWRLHSTIAARPRANLSTYEMDDPVVERVSPWIDGVNAQLAIVPSTDASIDVEITEGFVSHVLYPEQYAAAAELWCRDRKGMAAATRAAVVGIHAIGVPLSAVVAAVLRLNGWRTSRFTVRPNEELPAHELTSLAVSTLMPIVDGDVKDGWASMTAVADALEATGIERRRLSFFPASTDDDPGPDGTYHVPLTNLRSAGYSMIERLVDRTMTHFNVDCSMREIVVKQIFCGAPIFWIIMPDGRSLNWRFAGLFVEEDGRPASTATVDALGEQAVDHILGFVATIVGDEMQKAA